MKLGILIRLKGDFHTGFELYRDEHIDPSKLRIANAKGIWFQNNEIGLILDESDVPWNKNQKNIYYKILTHQGIGWIPSHYAESLA